MSNAAAAGPNRHTNRRLVLLVPGITAATQDLVTELTRADYDVVVRDAPAWEPELAPTAIVVNVFALGSVEDWPEALRKIVGQKLASRYADVPMLIINPPADVWNLTGGWECGVDGYLLWPADPGRLAAMLHRLTDGDDLIS